MKRIMRKILLVLFFCGCAVLPTAGKAGAVSAGTAGKEEAYPGASNYRDFRYHALIIGVDIAPVKGRGSTCHDPFASQLSGFLKSWACFSKGGVAALKSGMGTKRRIRETISNLHLGPKDVLLIYYGGHGDWDGLASSDEQRLSPAELSEYMSRSGAGFKALLISACYSGLFADPEDKGRYFQRPGFAVVTSGEEDGTSTYASQGIGFGPYLWKLLNMKEKAPHATVTLGEFIDIIKYENALWKKSGKYRLSDGWNYGPRDAVLFWK